MRIPLTSARSLGPRPELLDALRADVTDYGNNRVWLPPPRAKKKRVLAAGETEATVAAEEAPTLPIVRLWPFAMLETFGNAALVVSPQILGPALVDFLDLTFDADNTAPRPSFGLRYSVVAPTPGNNLVLDGTTLGTSLFETASAQIEGGGAEFQDAQHLAKFTLDGVNARVRYTLRKIVDEARFFLNLAMGTQGAGTHRAAGYVRVVEGLTIAELRAVM